jgi:hypothetical protein
VTVGHAQTPTVEVSNVLRLGLRARLRAVHEARMTSERSRRRLAEDFERAVARADQPSARFSAVIPVCDEARGAARGALLDLAERLRAPRRADPNGVRLARRLLHDGAGPLYVPLEPGELHAAVLQTLGALDAHGAGS